VVEEASRGNVAVAGLNLLLLDVAAGGEILGRGLEGLHLLGYLFVYDIAAGVHQGIVEPVIEPLLVHGAETGVVVQDEPGLDVSLVCMEAYHPLSRMSYPATSRVPLYLDALYQPGLRVDHDFQLGTAEVSGEGGDKFILIRLGAAAKAVTILGKAAKWLGENRDNAHSCQLGLELVRQSRRQPGAIVYGGDNRTGPGAFDEFRDELGSSRRFGRSQHEVGLGHVWGHEFLGLVDESGQPLGKGKLLDGPIGRRSIAQVARYPLAVWPLSKNEYTHLHGYYRLFGIEGKKCRGDLPPALYSFY
jgi:hypothetical protein